MNTETQVATDAATEITASEVTTNEPAEVVEQQVEGQEPVEVEKPQPSEAEKRAKALQRRVDRLTQQKYELSARLEQQQQSRPPETQDDERPPTKEQLDALINQRAQEIARQQAVGQRLDSVESALKKAVGPAYDDFVEDLKSAGRAASTFVQTAMELDDADKVLAHFVNDREELDRVLRMSPVKQAAYMGRLSAQLDTKPSVSTAPRPLTPLNSRAPRTNAAPMSDEDYVRSIRSAR